MKREEKWVVLAKSADFNGIGATYGVDPVIARIVRNREVTGKEALDAYFQPSERCLHDPALLKGAKEAADLLRQKIAEQKMPDLNASSVESAMSMIAGTARSMGIEVVD